MLSVNYDGKFLFCLENIGSVTDVKNEIEYRLGIPSDDYYLLSNGKRFTEPITPQQCPLHIIPKLIGGKGGFGSMLRAIGAQIEKTTNREACRDLSGRRLRDINEEKRLKTWIAQQVERENEADDRRKKKLERLCHKPKHEFKDESYEQERSALPEKVEDALEQGLKACTSSVPLKRKNNDKNGSNKKPRLWVDSDEDLSLSENDSENEDVSSVKEGEDNKVSSSNEISKESKEIKETVLEQVDKEAAEKEPVELKGETKKDSIIENKN